MGAELISPQFHNANTVSAGSAGADISIDH